MSHEIDTNLIRTNIRRADNGRLKKMRYNSDEPIYSVIRRLIDMTDTEKSDMSYMMEEYRQASATWKDKYFKIQKEFADYKKKVHGSLEKFLEN